jgi:hypothetical protein
LPFFSTMCVADFRGVAWEDLFAIIVF